MYPGRCHSVVAPLVLFSRCVVLAIAGDGRLKHPTARCGATTWTCLTGEDDQGQTTGQTELTSLGRQH